MTDETPFDAEQLDQRLVGMELAPPLSDDELVAMLAQARAEIRHQIQHAKRPSTAASRMANWPRVGIAGIAAIALTVIGILGYRGNSARHIGSLQAYTTRVGERVTIALANGSRMTLAPTTRVLVRTTAASGTTIDLTGEAYFEVAHASAAPFVVRTGAIATQVLGTAFDVQRYGGDRETRVAVTQGRVAVTTARRHYVVSAGLAARATDSTVVAADDATSAVAWNQGRLVFRRAPLPEVLASVERWYGVHFQLADSTLAQRHLTTTLELGPVTDVLRELTLVLDVTMTGHPGADSTVTLHPRHSGATRRQPLSNTYPFTTTVSQEVGR